MAASISQVKHNRPNLGHDSCAAIALPVNRNRRQTAAPPSAKGRCEQCFHPGGSADFAKEAPMITRLDGLKFVLAAAAWAANFPTAPG